MYRSINKYNGWKTENGKLSDIKFTFGFDCKKK